MRHSSIHPGVCGLDHGIGFRFGLFGGKPAVRKCDSAKRMIEDPGPFAISTGSGAIEVRHPGLQGDSADDLAGIRAAFAAADTTSPQDESDAHCCSSNSGKHRVVDPHGVACEECHTVGETRHFRGNNVEPSADSQCCAQSPDTNKAPEAERVVQAGATTTACCTPPHAAATCCAPAAGDPLPRPTARCCA